jgi:hypothetical protein
MKQNLVGRVKQEKKDWKKKKWIFIQLMKMVV